MATTSFQNTFIYVSFTFGIPQNHKAGFSTEVFLQQWFMVIMQRCVLLSFRLPLHVHITDVKANNCSKAIRRLPDLEKQSLFSACSWTDVFKNSRVYDDVEWLMMKAEHL